MNSLNGKTTLTSGYAPVNDLKMYFEIEGTGEPLVYLPPAFGFAGLKSFPALVDLEGRLLRRKLRWGHSDYDRSSPSRTSRSRGDLRSNVWSSADCSEYGNAAL